MSHVGKLQQLNRFQIRCYNEYNKTSQMTTNSMWPKFKVFLLLKIHSLLLSLFWYYFSLRLCINTVAWKMSPRSFVFLFSNKTTFSSQKNYFCLLFVIFKVCIFLGISLLLLLLFEKVSLVCFQTDTIGFSVGLLWDVL